MNPLFFIALTTGILSGLLAWCCDLFGLITWAAFLGCTTYFANPLKGPAGLATGILANFSGVAWAMLVIILGGYFDNQSMAIAIFTGLISFAMCIQAIQKLLRFIPGAFVGACALFAGQGDWMLVSLSLCVGGTFAFLMKFSGEWLAVLSTSKTTQIDENN